MPPLDARWVDRAAQRQAAILSAVAFAAERFLKTVDWRSCIDEVLAKLGSATGVSRIYIFENSVADDGTLCASQTHEWAAAGIEPQLPNEQLQALPYTSDALEPLRDTVSRGETLVELVREMPEAARAVLESQNIVSIAIVPIITCDDWKGFIGFDDCAHERAWSEVELDALKAASGILGAAMQRAADEARIRHKEDQLLQAQKMEAIGNLAGGIAHDFNNVLQVIWLSSQVLRARLGAEGKAYGEIDTIGEAVLRARSLPNQLLAFARRQVVQPQVLDLQQCVAEIAGLVRRVIGEDVQLDVRPASESLVVRVDPVQLQQAVMNIILNAREAMPRGGAIRVTTRAELVECEHVSRHARIPAGRFAIVSVEDDGIGMDEDTLERLFEPFYTTKARGHGIGLATAYGIVKQNQGHITVESEPARGSCFSLYFPLASQQDVPHTDRVVESMPPGCETILVAEDEAPLRQALQDQLIRLGYRVIVAEDGLAAAQRVQEVGGQIDLLLTDVVMPKTDGVTLAESLSTYPGMQVLFMSGHAYDVLERRGIDPAKVDVLRKPFSASELAQRVRAMLDR